MTPELVQLLKHMGVEGPEELATQLRKEPEQVEQMARHIASNPRMEILKKLSTTSNIGVSHRLEADFGYVGLPAEASECCFDVGFREYMKPRLGQRAESFQLIFEHLKNVEQPLIVETGCLRVPDNWEGDGQSTFQFDWFAREHHGTVFTVDINPDSIESTRRACSNVTTAMLTDSVSVLRQLAMQCARPASLLYLDSFDLDVTDPLPSAIHHAMEMMAAGKLIGPGTLICVDDFNVPPLGPGGKGMIVDSYLHAIRAEVLYCGYQKLWRISGDASVLKG